MIKLRFDRVGLVSLIRNGAACATFKSRSASCSAKNADEFGPSLLLAGHEPRPPGARSLLASTRAPVCAPTRMPLPPIIAACTSVDKLQVRKLLEKDAGLVHEGGPNGNLPLHCAVAKESAASLAVIKICWNSRLKFWQKMTMATRRSAWPRPKGMAKLWRCWRRRPLQRRQQRLCERRLPKKRKQQRRRRRQGTVAVGVQTTRVGPPRCNTGGRTKLDGSR